jgi:5'-nucleotidase
VIPAKNPKGQPVYWIGPAGASADAGAGTDFLAVESGYVSVTPLSIDQTRHAALPTIERWLESL